MPRSVRTYAPTLPPSLISTARAGSIDTVRGELTVDLADGDRMTFHAMSAGLVRTSDMAPQFNETPLLPGVAPEVVSYMADAYSRASARLRRRKRARVRLV